MPLLLTLVCSLAFGGPALRGADAPTTSPTTAPAFRTDAGPADDKLPWFQLAPGEFPPEGSAHSIAGELIAVDHVNRTGVLRPDRTDAQRRGEWDLPLPFTLLPFGSVSYHGAPADLKDVPLGTHLHGQFYADPLAKPEKGKRVAVENIFRRVLKLEDDFSYFQRQGRRWRVDSVDVGLATLTVTGVGPGDKVDAKPTVFQVAPSTRVFRGRSFATLADVSPGQQVLLNLTVCTLKGPGRAVAIWLDDESRAVAAAHQVEVHRQHQREHGLAGWVDAVDNKEGIVSVILFAGFDPKLRDDFAVNGGITAVVADDALRTWDQINDRKGGSILKVENVPAQVGSSGVRVTFKPVMLLEGFRPKRVIRVFAGGWKVDDLPREERLYQ